MCGFDVDGDGEGLREVVIVGKNDGFDVIVSEGTFDPEGFVDELIVGEKESDGNDDGLDDIVPVATFDMEGSIDKFIVGEREGDSDDKASDDFSTVGKCDDDGAPEGSGDSFIVGCCDGKEEESDENDIDGSKEGCNDFINVGLSVKEGDDDDFEVATNAEE